jgi:hypothetical protein
MLKRGLEGQRVNEMMIYITKELEIEIIVCDYCNRIIDDEINLKSDNPCACGICGKHICLKCTSPYFEKGKNWVSGICIHCMTKGFSLGKTKDKYDYHKILFKGKPYHKENYF